jgi:hypothetical protein
VEWTRRSRMFKRFLSCNLPHMGTSAGVVNGASAGADINHDLRKSLANPRGGVQCREMESRSAALPMLNEALLPAFYDMGTGGLDSAGRVVEGPF